MIGKINFRSNIVVFGIPLLMFLSLIAITKSSNLVSEISLFVLIDLLIIIPFVYFLLIRHKDISNKTIIVVALLGFFIAGFILPKENLRILNSIKIYVLPFIEVLVLFFVLIKSRRALKKVKESKNNSLDFYETVQIVCAKIVPQSIGNILAAEISVIYYSIFNWRKRKLNENEFSYHKESTANSVILGFLLVIIVEMFVTHSMMKMGNNKGTFVLTALSIYTFLQILALLKSLSRRPIFIDLKKEQVVLKFGILANATIPFKTIKEIEVSTKEFSEKSPIKYFSPLGNSAGHNVIIHLNKEIKFESFYGFKKKATSLAIFIDAKNEFVNLIKKEMINH